MNELLTKFSQFILPLLTASLLAACGGGSDDNASSAPAGSLIKAEALNTYTVNGSLRLIAFSVVSGRSYDVEVVKLTYNTTLEAGNIVQASGIVAIPKAKTGLSPLLSYQHATVFKDSAVPSNDPLFDMTPLLAASAGFVALAPDYIGYGESKALTHSYIQAIPSANSVIDLLRAAKTYLRQRDIPLNDQLFLAGYSEGGYATLATHQRIQTQLANEMTVTASIAGGGPYDVRGMADQIILNETSLDSPAYFGYVVHAYDRMYDLDNLTLRAIASPHHMTIDNYYDGNSTGSTINAILPRNTDELFNPYFQSEYAGIAGELSLKYRLDQNGVYDWKPTAPVKLFHGQNDSYVSYDNASKALSTMQANGADSVTLTNCAAVPSNHLNCGVAFATFATNYLLTVATDR
ncbi:MAG: alpha/beta hydrolase family protein [Leucothrix sp.]